MLNTRKRYRISLAILFIHSFTCISSCTGSQTVSDHGTTGAGDSLIVLVNIGDLNRKGLADVIHAVNECNPRAFGINAIFSQIESPPDHSDSLLSQAIKSSDVIVLVENMGNTSSERIKSDPFFSPMNLGNRVDTGILLYAFDDKDRVNYYVPLFEDDAGQSTSFPLLLAITYDPYAYANFVFENRIGVNDFEEIEYDLGMEDLQTLKPDSLPCENILGKIVILGYLGPRKENTRPTPLGPDTYSTVIVANILHNILETKRHD